MKEWAMSEGEAIEQLRQAVKDEGTHPHYHRRILRRHRREWPVLWKAIDRLLEVVDEAG